MEQPSKNLCAVIPLALHNRVREEQEKSGQTLSAYITTVLTSYYEREENAMKINDKRTLHLANLLPYNSLQKDRANICA